MRHTLHLPILLLAACASSPAEPLDPTGTWAMVLSPGAGDCGFTDATPIRVAVSGDPSGYTLSGLEPDLVSGQIVCSPTACQMDLHDQGSGVAGDGTPFNALGEGIWGLDASLTISGVFHTHLTFQTGSTCSQGFTTTGHVE